MSASRHSQAHLALLVETQGHRQLHLAHPMGPSSRCQHLGVLAQKCKGVDVSGAEEVGMLMPNPIQASTRGWTAKQMVQVPTCAGQTGIAAQQQRPLRRGK